MAAAVELAAGDHFGERALLYGDSRAADVDALEKTTCVVISKRAFELVLGPMHELIEAS